MSYEDETPGFKVEQSDDWLPELREVMARRTPSLLDVGIKGGWAGLYEQTPDHNALIGELDADGTRFLYATGFSGHGFLQAPGVGEIVRDMVLGVEPFVDVAELSVDRFAAERLRPERNIV
jgi:sarcosine oxidase subunit beta